LCKHNGNASVLSDFTSFVSECLSTRRMTQPVTVHANSLTTEYTALLNN